MKLRLGAKILAGLMALTGLLLISGLVTIFYTHRLHRVNTELLNKSIASLKAAQELEVTLFRMKGLMFNYILDGDPSWLEAFAAEKLEFQTWLSEAKKSATALEESEILAAIASHFANYEQQRESALAAVRHDSSQARLLRASRQAFDTLYEQCEEFVDANENAMFVAEEQVEQTNRLVRLTMYGLGLGGIIIGGILGLVISRNILQPIYKLVLKVRGAADAELVEKMDVESGAELEDLDRRVHALIVRMNATAADLEKHRRLLARADKLAALGKVSAGVAHEIRNPLTAVKMLIYSLREETATNDETRSDLSVIMKELERIERFVQNFLEFARPPDPHFAPVDLNASIRETLALLAPRLRQSQIAVIETYCRDLGLVPADADQLKQVLMNLLLNAVDAMPNGGRLKIVTQRTEAGLTKNGKTWVQIHISDTGKGIPAELLDNLFDPFVTGSEEGTGIGLAIAHQIITRHGGWVEAKNENTGGATITVSLPADEDARRKT